MKYSNMKENIFSIVMPTCGRPNLTIRAIQSVQDQIYPYWELIIVDDGSEPDIKEKLEKYVKDAKDKRIKLLHHPQRIQRCASRNTGMKATTKNWICWLDSDDEYLRTYLNSANWAINEYPDYKIFHWGAIVCGLRGYRVRECVDIKEEGKGMERFKSGSIGAGSFIFKRELLKEVGYLPEVGSPYKLSDLAKEEFPEIVEWYGPTYLEGGKELGNPWGDDWLMFYKLTRKHKSKGVPFLTYVQYVRRSGFIEQDNDLILNRKRIYIA